MIRSETSRFHTHFRATLGVSALVLAGITGCSDGTGPAAGPPAAITALPRALTAPEQQAIRASNAFGLELLRRVAAGAADSNVVLSPFSASMALGMAYAGADGTTADAMRTTLGWGTAPRAQVLDGYRNLRTLLTSLDPRVTVTTANALWVRDGFSLLPGYTQDMNGVFGATIRNGDFGPTTVNEINAWAARETNNRIPRVVESLSSDMVAMLLNALYFKGAWRERFDPARTEVRSFTTAGGGRPAVPMMQRLGSLPYGMSRGAQITELAYGNTAYVMTLVLPAAGSSPRAWLDGVTDTDFSAAVNALAPQQVQLALPKFRLKVGYQLRTPLTAMGMGVAFIRGQANFTRMANAELFLTHVKQDVFIDVNEEGTEAAAVTQVGVGLVSAPQIFEMHLDRPFLFFIRERLSGTILFSGIINLPVTSN
jgi:serpin B